jgi:hypothetical protein
MRTQEEIEKQKFTLNLEHEIFKIKLSLFFFHDLDHMFFKDSAMDFCKDYFIQHNQMSKETDVHINNRPYYNVYLTMQKDKKLFKLVNPTSIHGNNGSFLHQGNEGIC